MRNEALFLSEQANYSSFQVVINKKNYLFRATFANADGYYVSFQKDAILDLKLIDKIYNPFIQGYIVIDNTEDVIERFKLPQTNKEFSPNKVPDIVGYRTRGDGRDLLYLTIIPLDPTQDPKQSPYNQNSLNYNKVYSFQYIFVLTDEEDIETNTGKAKKYTLGDLDYVILKEKKIFFSSTNLLPGNQLAFLSDLNRRAPTGDCMKYILQTGLEAPGAVYSTLSGNKNVTPFFESGASNIFYSSPNDYTAYDDLMYIYEFHVSNDAGKDFSFLQKDNFTGEYTLESASSIFTKAYNQRSDSGSQYFIENLTIAGGQTYISNIIQNDKKKPLHAIEFGESGDIQEVKFFNTPGLEFQDKIKTILVHDYDFDRTTFNVNSVDGDIEKIKKDFSKLYVQPMKGKNNLPSPHFILNNTQKTNQNFENKFLIYNQDNDALKIAVGRNEILKRALKLNLGVEITVQGGLQRKSGKFISIDRTGSYIDNDFDSKFLGIYFILQVEHQFIGNDQYISKILAVKTYHFTDPQYNENTP